MADIGKRIDEHTQREIVRLWVKGDSIRSVAKSVRVSPTTVQKTIKLLLHVGTPRGVN